MGLLGAVGLHELNEYAAGALGMEEGDAVSPGAGPRGLVDRAEAVPPEAVQRLLDIRDPERHVVDSGAATLEEASHRGIRGPGLEELDRAHEGDVDALVWELLDRGTLLAGEEFEERPAVGDGADGDGHVIDRMRIHIGSGVRLGLATPWTDAPASAASYRRGRDITRRRSDE